MFRFTKYSRAKKFLEEDLSKKELEKKFHKIGMQLNTLETIRAICFVLFYSSIVSGFLSVFPLFDFLSESILKFSGLIGGTVFLIIIAFTSKLIGDYSIDLILLAGRLKNARYIRKKKK